MIRKFAFRPKREILNWARRRDRTEPTLRRNGGEGWGALGGAEGEIRKIRGSPPAQAGQGVQVIVALSDGEL